MCKETITLYTRCQHQVRAHEPCKLKSMHMVNHAASSKPQGDLDDFCPECKTNGAGRAVTADDTAGAPATAAQPSTGASLVDRFSEWRQERKRRREAVREAELSAKMRDYLPEPFPMPSEFVFNGLMSSFNPLEDDNDFEALQRAIKERSEGRPREG